MPPSVDQGPARGAPMKRKKVGGKGGRHRELKPIKGAGKPEVLAHLNTRNPPWEEGLRTLFATANDILKKLPPNKIVTPPPPARHAAPHTQPSATIRCYSLPSPRAGRERGALVQLETCHRDRVLCPGFVPCFRPAELHVP